MNNETNKSTAEKTQNRLQEAILNILIFAFAIIVLGTALLPAVIAYLFTWRWLLVYPAALIFIIALASINGLKK